jgi:polysaccharide deacetylase 2 family uncharacterized protein YibQ
MAFSPAALLERFRRNKVQDPFGGDDLFDGGESRFAGQGPKIALIASGVMFLLLLGGVAAIFLTGDKTAGTQIVSGSLSDLQVVEDDHPADAPAGSPAAQPNAEGQAPAADATAATDRSAARRPWLAQTPAPEAAPRLGMDADKAKDAKPDTKTANAKPVEANPADTKSTEAKPAEAKPAETKPADAKPADTKMAAVMAPPAATAPVMPPTKEGAKDALKEAAKAGAPTSLLPSAPAKAEPGKSDAKVEPAEDNDPAKDIAGIPALQAAGQAPGAPRRFDAPAGDGQASVAGGRPRLVEPPLPPTDKIAVAAPPPRYANLTDVKRDAGSPAPAPNAIKVAFIVDGLGLSQSATDAAITKLPAAVTLAFSPYARDLKKWMEKAKEKGHEVLIEVPMESKQFPADDPGPLGLLTSAEPKENADRLETILKEATSAIGILDTTGSKFRESSEHISPVFAKLKQSNLFYVQGMPGARMGDAGIPTAIADLVLDERPFRAAVDARLDYAERLAKYQGSAVVALGAKPVNFERMVLWIEQSQKKGIVLAPISQVLIKQ